MLESTLLFHFVVVAAGDAGQDLRALVASLKPNWCGARAALTVVDNGATCSLDAITVELSHSSVLRPMRNLGYGAAINEAVRQSVDAAAWIVACNADLVFESDVLARLGNLVEMAPAEVGCIAPRLLDPPQGDVGVDRRTQPSIGSFPTLRSLLARRTTPRRTRKYIPTPALACDVDWATGACLLIRTSAFAAIGGFDSEFFLDYEDVDLCRRLRLNGWRVRCEPGWCVTHRSPNAARPISANRHVHTRASLVRYWAKHRPAWEFHALGQMMNAATSLRSAGHPLMPAWRSGAETYRSLARGMRKERP